MFTSLRVLIGMGNTYCHGRDRQEHCSDLGQELHELGIFLHPPRHGLGLLCRFLSCLRQASHVFCIFGQLLTILKSNERQYLAPYSISRGPKTKILTDLLQAVLAPIVSIIFVFVI